MDVMLQGHGAKYIFPLPEGLRELSSDISREVLRSQPDNIYGFIADYCDILLRTRESAVAAAKKIDSMLKHDVTFEALLAKRGITLDEAHRAATIIQAAFRGYYTRKELAKRPRPGDPVLERLGLSKELAEAATITIQSAFRGYIVRKSLCGQVVVTARGETGTEEHTAMIKAILDRCHVSRDIAEEAATRIQSIFRGYSVRHALRDSIPAPPEEGEGRPSEAKKEGGRARRRSPIPVVRETLYSSEDDESLLEEEEGGVEEEEIMVALEEGLELEEGGEGEEEEEGEATEKGEEATEKGEEATEKGEEATEKGGIDEESVADKETEENEEEKETAAEGESDNAEVLSEDTNKEKQDAMTTPSFHIKDPSRGQLTGSQNSKSLVKVE